MSNIRIRTRNGEYLAELDGSDISNAVWLSLPFTTAINMFGGQIYFEMPAGGAEPEGSRVTKLEVGDIAYWPKVGALCIFFGPTPLSGDDGHPVSKYSVVKIGRILDDCSSMDSAGDRQRITLERAF
ncbi:MAG: cyclophilin-like fold protein [Methanomassiliicoccaceae archaeon]|nr:cyclophilin-like fold protein [Methanomassiliicoccaceae archaeon]